MSDPVATWSSADGQPAAVAILRRSLQRDELGHALLVVGPREAGQQELARALAAAINCPEGSGDEGCGTCSTCVRVSRGVHPTTIDFVPEGASHLIAAVREDWAPAANRTLVEGRRRIIRIVEADRMSEPTQNAFLKLLEEPPASVVWVLEAEDETQLLDTIISRCRRIDVTTWNPDALTRRARRIGVAEADIPGFVRAAMGSPARLDDLADAHLTDDDVRLLAEKRALADDHLGGQLKDLRKAWTAKRPKKTGRGAAEWQEALVAWEAERDVEVDALLAPIWATCQAELSQATSRREHLALLGRLAEAGPGAVPTFAKQVVEWARSRETLQKAHNETELEHLETELGIDQGARWPAGMKTRVTKRHDRTARDVRQRALDTFLDELASYLRDMLVVQAGGSVDGLVNIDHLDGLRLDATRLGAVEIIATLAAIADCREAIEANGQPELQLERLLYKLAIPLYRAA